MIKVFFTLILSCIIAFRSADAATSLKKYEDECISFIKAPKVTVTSTYGKLRYDYGKDKKYLQKETSRRFQEQGEELYEGFDPVGLTKVRDAFDFAVTVSQIDVSNGYTCFYPEAIKVHLGYYTPTIYILNSLKKGSCLYNLAERHEKTHMQIYIEALDYFLSQLKETANGLFDRVGVKIVKRGYSGKKAAEELNNAYLAVIQAKVENWRKAVEKEQLKLDTPEQYILENKLCQELEGKNSMF